MEHPWIEPVDLDVLLPSRIQVTGDKSLEVRRRTYREDRARRFLEDYLAALLPSCKPEKLRCSGEVAFMLTENTSFDMYALLDERLADQPPECPYLVYGVLLIVGFKILFFKWERHSDGSVTKDACKTIFNVNRSKQVRDFISPTIRTMLSEVDPLGDKVKVLEAGVDYKEILDPIGVYGKNWVHYPLLVR